MLGRLCSTRYDRCGGAVSCRAHGHANDDAELAELAELAPADRGGSAWPGESPARSCMRAVAGLKHRSGPTGQRPGGFCSAGDCLAGTSGASGRLCMFDSSAPSRFLSGQVFETLLGAVHSLNDSGARPVRHGSSFLVPSCYGGIEPGSRQDIRFSRHQFA